MSIKVIKPINEYHTFFLFFGSDMPRQIIFKIGKNEFTASPVKVDRRKFYSWTKLMAVDDNGDPNHTSGYCDCLTVNSAPTTYLLIVLPSSRNTKFLVTKYLPGG